ncbi:MAG: hypothetical protein ACI9WL_000472 [Rubritalea sp.]|jgi:hypothetical protein
MERQKPSKRLKKLRTKKTSLKAKLLRRFLKLPIKEFIF